MQRIRVYVAPAHSPSYVPLTSLPVKPSNVFEIVNRRNPPVSTRMMLGTLPRVRIMPRNPAKRLLVVLAPIKPTPTRGHPPLNVPIAGLTRPVEQV